MLTEFYCAFFPRSTVLFFCFYHLTNRPHVHVSTYEAEHRPQIVAGTNPTCFEMYTLAEELSNSPSTISKPMNNEMRAKFSVCIARIQFLHTKIWVSGCLRSRNQIKNGCRKCNLLPYWMADMWQRATKWKHQRDRQTVRAKRNRRNAVKKNQMEKKEESEREREIEREKLNKRWSK